MGRRTLTFDNIKFFTKKTLRKYTHANSVLLAQNQKSLTTRSVNEDDSSFRRKEKNSGLVSTQQLPLDNSLFYNNTFFGSAEVKVNVAFEKIINKYPFDSSFDEVERFEDSLSSFEKHVLEAFPKSRGFLNFDSDSAQHIIIKDAAGNLSDALLKGAQGTSYINPKRKSFSVECCLRLPTIANGNSFLFHNIHKDADVNVGYAAYFNANAETKEAKINFVLVSGSNNTAVSYTLNKGQWYNLSFVYDRGTSQQTIRIASGSRSLSESDVFNFAGLDTFNSDLDIGDGNNITAGNLSFVKASTFSGAIDEFRVFHNARESSEIDYYSRRDIFAHDDLRLLLRFNEPTGSHTNNNMVLDHSGNSLHAKINNFTTSMRDPQGIDNPMLLENERFNPVLFPTNADVEALNSKLLNNASLYDVNNPNLITRLIPNHYLQDGAFFDGVAVDGEIVEAYGNSSNLPGSGRLGSAQLMSLLLYFMAEELDAYKMYIDQASQLLNPDYLGEEGTADTFLPHLAKHYGFELPNIFGDVSLEQFTGAESLGLEYSIYDKNLSQIQSLIWRRVLKNLNHIFNSKGTKYAIETIFRSAGIEPDRLFRLVEYNGKKEFRLGASRQHITEMSTMLNFSGSLGKFEETSRADGTIFKRPTLLSAPLTASRIEPGFPEIAGGNKLAAATINFHPTNINEMPITGTKLTVKDGFNVTRTFEFVSVAGAPPVALAASATITITESNNLLDSGATTIQITTTDGTVITATAHASVTTLSDTSSPTFEVEAPSEIDTATNLAACLNANVRLSAINANAVVTVTQVELGSFGNTTIVVSDPGGGGLTKTDFVNGRNIPLNKKDDSNNDKPVTQLLPDLVTLIAESFPSSFVSKTSRSLPGNNVDKIRLTTKGFDRYGLGNHAITITSPKTPVAWIRMSSTTPTNKGSVTLAPTYLPSASHATFTVTAGTTAHGTTTLQSITIISTDQTTKKYVIVHGGADGTEAEDTGKVLAQDDAYSDGSTIPAAHAAIGGIAVNILDDDNQREVLAELKTAIDHTNGHNAGTPGSKITVPAPDVADGTAQFIILVQTVVGSVGSTTVTNNIANLTAENFSGNPITIASETVGGVTRQTAAFDGYNDSLLLGDAATWDALIGDATGSTKKMSFAFWVKKTGDGGGTYGRIIDFGNRDITVYTDSSDRVFFGVSWTPSGGTQQLYQWYTAADKVPVGGSFVHVAITYDASVADPSLAASDPKIYINGAETSTTGTRPAADAAYFGLNSLAYIGNEYGLERTFNGKISEALIFNDVLTAAEVSAIYNAKTDESIPPFISAAGFTGGNGFVNAGNPGFENAGISATENDGLLTSGSWTVEGIYQFPSNLSKESKRSLSRIVTQGNGTDGGSWQDKHAVITNLVLSPFGDQLTLYVRNNYDNSSAVFSTALTGANCLDGRKWYICYGRKRNDELNNPVSSSFFIRAASHNYDKITSFLTTESFFNEGTASKNMFQNLKQSDDVKFHAPQLLIGSQSFVPGSGGKFLNDQTLGKVPTDAQVSYFDGKVGHIRFWSKALREEESLEHARNFKSVGVSDPLVNNTFSITRSGSFEKLRLNLSTDQIELETSPNGKLDLTDFSQNYSIKNIDKVAAGVYTSISGGVCFEFETDKRVIEQSRFDYTILSPFFDEYLESDKIKIAGFSDGPNIKLYDSKISPVTEIFPFEKEVNDNRFEVQIHLQRGLDEDIMNIFSTIDALDNALGKPELVFSQEYPDLNNMRQIYFNRLTDKVNYRNFFDLFRWLDDAFSDMIERLVPRNSNFLGINLIIESHALERYKIAYGHQEIYKGPDERANLRSVLLISQRSGVLRRF